MQDFAWLDDWIDELQTESMNTAEERHEKATVKDHSASTKKSINSTQNENNAINTCLPISSGFSYKTGASNRIVASNNFQDIETPSFNDRKKTPDKDHSNDLLASIEPNSMKDKKERKTGKILNETARKRRYRVNERMLFHRLRELLPDDAQENTSSKHQLLQKAITAIEEFQKLKSCHTNKS